MGYYRRSVRLFLLLFLAILVLSGIPNAQGRSDRSPVQEPRVARYRITGVATREARSAIAATGAAIDGVGREFVDITAASDELERLTALGFDITQPPALLDFPPADAAYHTYDEMTKEVREVAAARPDIVSPPFSIGQSYEGRELLAVKVSDNPTADEDEPEALFVGHYHAREHLTVEMMLYILHMLVDEYDQPNRSEIAELVNDREIFLIFDLNPDGGEFDIATGKYGRWRKNRQPNGDGTYGVDMNRNHSYRWGLDNEGSSPSTASETYRGSAPASAPEVAAIERFVNSRVVSGVQQISVAITFHAYGEWVLWPYGYTYEDTPLDMRAADRLVLEMMGRTMARTNGYTAMQSSDLYTTNGDFADWAYGVHRIFAYTFEMSSASDGFYPPGSSIAQEVSRNRQAVLYLLQQAGCPYAVAMRELEYCDAGRIRPSRPTWLPLISQGVAF